MFIDSHCHFDFPVFAEDRQRTVEHLQRLNVHALIVPGVVAEHWSRIDRLVADFPTLVFAAKGLHPCFAEHSAADLERLPRELDSPNCIAVGEIGLDYTLPESTWPQQWEYFVTQLEMASTHQLPVVIHCRKAHDQILKALRQMDFSQGGTIHAYSGSEAQAHRYIERGFKLGIGGGATYDRAQRLHRLLRALPLNSFVLETDAPDIPPAFARDRINTPVHLPEIAAQAAERAGINHDAFVTAAYQNTLGLFGACLAE